MEKSGGGASLAPEGLFRGYTLAEILIVMLVIAVVVAVSIGITKSKLDKITSYTYYSAYSTLRQVSRKMLGNFNAKDDKYILSANLFELPVYAEMKRWYHCAREAYDVIPGTTAAPQLNVTYSVAKSYDINSLDCSTTERWFEANAYEVSRNYFRFEKCPGKYVFPEGNRTNEYWDADRLRDTYIIRTNIDPWNHTRYECTFPCGDGTNNCGNLAVRSYPERFFCFYGSGETNHQFVKSVEDSLNSWPICYYEYEEPDPVPELPDCNTPSLIEQEHAYCLHGYQGFNSSPDVCDYTIKPSSWPPVCEDGYRWNNLETDCRCIPETRTLPRNGQNFCKLFVSYINTKTNSPECSGDAISDNITDLSSKTADITFRNGMRLYNVSQNPQEIPDLANNKEGGSYEGVPNVNTFGYTVYVDIDGESGSSTLWEDVYPFYITMSGMVIPAYDSENPEVSGGDSRNHLIISVEKDSYTLGRRQIQWLKKSVSFKEGACSSGFIAPETPYCSGIVEENSCVSGDGRNLCRIKHIKPVKFLF